MSFLLGFEELPPPQVLRNEDSRLLLTFTFLFPQRQSGGDGYRGKQQQEETFLTVTAISASVISIKLLPRAPWDRGILRKPMNPLGPRHMLLKTTSTRIPNVLFSQELITDDERLPCMSCNYHVTQLISLVQLKQGMLWKNTVGLSGH